MGLPPLKTKNTSGTVTNAATLAIEFPDGMIESLGTKSSIVDTRASRLKNGQISNASLSTWKTASYANTVGYTAAGDLLSFGPNFDLAAGTPVYVSSPGTLPGGLTANTLYYYTQNRLYTASGTVIDITSSGTGLQYIHPVYPNETTGLTNNAALALVLTAQTSNLLGSRIHSFRITKSANIAAGDMVAVPLTILKSDLGKILEVSFDYDFSDANYSDGDIQVWVRDVTNKVAYQLTPSNVLKGKDQFRGVFQSSINSQSYELQLYYLGRNTLAQVLDFDNVEVKQQNKVYGSTLTDWQSYSIIPTATTTAPTFGTNVQSARWRRVGDSVEINYTYHQTAAGTAGSGAYLFNLPPGLSADTSKATIATTLPAAGSLPLGATVIGHGYASRTSAGDGTGTSWLQGFLYSATHISFAGTSGIVNAGWSLGSSWTQNFSSNPFYVSFNVRVPIAGWGSTQLLSTDADSRVCVARARMSASQTAALTSGINFDTRVFDTHGAISITAPAGTTGGWRFTAPMSGYYNASMAAVLTSGTADFGLYVNGVKYANLGAIAQTLANSLGTMVKLNVGDYLDFRTAAGLNNVDGTYCHCTIERVTGPAQIAAVEKVTAFYAMNGVQTIPINTTTVMQFNQKVSDSHMACQTGAAWRFTAPKAGLYHVVAGHAFAAAANNQINYLYKNGLAYLRIQQDVGTTAGEKNYSCYVDLLMGDYIDLRVTQATGSVNLDGTAANNFIQIVSV